MNAGKLNTVGYHEPPNTQQQHASHKFVNGAKGQMSPVPLNPSANTYNNSGLGHYQKTQAGENKAFHEYMHKNNT